MVYTLIPGVITIKDGHGVEDEEKEEAEGGGEGQ
jgi:hypothetical protein